jgi:hypothetical protein
MQGMFVGKTLVQRPIMSLEDKIKRVRYVTRTESGRSYLSMMMLHRSLRQRQQFSDGSTMMPGAALFLQRSSIAFS